MILALLLQAAAPAACPTPVSPPPELAGWTMPRALSAAGELVVGRAYRVPLRPVGTVRFAVPQGRAAKPGSRAGAFGFAVARAGTYRVALDSGLWVDVVGGGRALASTAHGHGPACSGVRKMVDFAMAPGRYVLQLSGADTAEARVMVARAD